MKYRIMAGQRIQPFSIDGNGVTTIHPHRRLKKDIVYSDKELVPPDSILCKYLGYHVSVGPDFYVFWLPSNPEGFAGFVVAKVRIRFEG